MKKRFTTSKNFIRKKFLSVKNCHSSKNTVVYMFIKKKNLIRQNLPHFIHTKPQFQCLSQRRHQWWYTIHVIVYDKCASLFIHRLLFMSALAPKVWFGALTFISCKKKSYERLFAAKKVMDRLSLYYMERNSHQKYLFIENRYQLAYCVVSPSFSLNHLPSTTSALKFHNKHIPPTNRKRTLFTIHLSAYWMLMGVFNRQIDSFALVFRHFLLEIASFIDNSDVNGGK